MSEEASKGAGGSQKKVTPGPGLSASPLLGPTESRELNRWFYVQYDPGNRLCRLFSFLLWAGQSFFGSCISLSGFCTLLGLTMAFGPITVLNVSAHSGILHGAEFSMCTTHGHTDSMGFLRLHSASLNFPNPLP